MEQGPNSKLPECFKSALHIIPEVLKLLALLWLNAELVINMQTKRKREVEASFQFAKNTPFTGFSPCCPCFAQNNQLPCFFREQTGTSSKEKCVVQRTKLFNTYQNLDFSLDITMGFRLFYNQILHFVISNKPRSAWEPTFAIVKVLSPQHIHN